MISTMIELGSLASLLAAGGLGGIITYLVTSMRERREARARALRALDAIERARFGYVPSESSAKGLVDERAELHAAALIAGVPRNAVAFYTALARVALWSNSESIEDDPAREWNHGPDQDLDGFTLAAADILVRVIWRPVIGRVQMTFRLARLKKKVAASGSAWLPQLKFARAAT